MFMTQAHVDSKKPATTSLGAAAAAAATHPATTPVTPVTPATHLATTPVTSVTSVAATATTPAATSSEAPSVDDDKKARAARKVFIVVGTVHEFDSATKAEKFLNGDGAPSDYSVLRGNRIGTSKKVSLR